MGISDVRGSAEKLDQFVDLIPIAFRLRATELVLDAEVEERGPEQLHLREVFRGLGRSQRFECRQCLVVSPGLRVGCSESDPGLIRVWFVGQHPSARLQKLI